MNEYNLTGYVYENGKQLYSFKYKIEKIDGVDYYVFEKEIELTTNQSMFYERAVTFA